MFWQQMEMFQRTNNYDVGDTRKERTTKEEVDGWR